MITLGGIPLVIYNGTHRWLELATICFGIGLGLALDEWVYLIATNGSDAAYLLPISFRGGVTMIILAICYTLLLFFLG